LYAYHKENNWKLAVNSLRNIIALATPKDYIYRSTLAKYLKGLKKFREAATEFEKVIASKPNYEGSYMELAESYGSLGQNADRIETYRRLIKALPNYAEGYNQLSWFLTLTGKHFDEAIEVAKKGLAACKRSSRYTNSSKYANSVRGSLLDTLGEAYYLKADALPDSKSEEKKKLYKEAEKQFHEATRLFRTNPSIAYNLCKAYEKNEKFSDASRLGHVILGIYGPFEKTKDLEALVKRVDKKLSSE
jgi:Tfp pilus assembly protein PilF